MWNFSKGSMSDDIFDGQLLAEKLSKVSNTQQSIQCILHWSLFSLLFLFLMTIFCLVVYALSGCQYIIHANFVWHDLFISWSTIATTPQFGFFGFRKIDVKKCDLYHLDVKSVFLLFAVRIEILPT